MKDSTLFFSGWSYFCSWVIPVSINLPHLPIITNILMAANFALLQSPPSFRPNYYNKRLRPNYSSSSFSSFTTQRGDLNSYPVSIFVKGFSSFNNFSLFSLVGAQGSSGFRRITCSYSNGRKPDPVENGEKSVDQVLEMKRRAELSAKIASGEFTVKRFGYA